MAEDWHARWEEGRIGWHETGGNASLPKYWPAVGAGSRVLVPLCGKSMDLLWLAAQGCDVTGVELSEIAARTFFNENALPFETSESPGWRRFVCGEPAITIECVDYFQFHAEPFDALYDRAALIALPAHRRGAYVSHTRSLLKTDAPQLLITLEYDQDAVNGPPFSVLPEEVARHWPELDRVSERNDIDNSPPKFRNAGLTTVTEAVWTAGTRASMQ